MKHLISNKILREFGYLIGILFPILIGWIFPMISGEHFRVWTIFISIPFIFAGAFKPRTLLYPYKGWMLIGSMLGWLNSHLILGFIFLFVLQPIALIMRLIGYDPLKIKKNNTLTYRERIENKKTDLNRIF